MTDAGLADASGVPLFSLGSLVATPAAIALLDAHGVDLFSLIARHQRGDWGRLSVDDAQANADALSFGGRLLSVYPVPAGGTGEAGENGANARRVWVLTEGDRSVTTVLCPEDY